MMSIKDLRRKKGFTQRELAKLVGVQPSMISRYEAGRVTPSFKKMKILAEALGVKTQDLIFSNPDTQQMKKIHDYEWCRRLLTGVNQGKCELCESPAPFKDKEGRPYLQLYEIDKDFAGSDCIKNLVVLCPTCYQRVCVLEDKDELDTIKEIAENHNF